MKKYLLSWNILKYILFKQSGTLAKLILEKIKDNNYFTEYQISQIIKGILQAVNYIHTKNIIHRDIKNGRLIISR